MTRTQSFFKGPRRHRRAAAFATMMSARRTAERKKAESAPVRHADRVKALRAAMLAKQNAD